jgi:hypothetical protein
VPAYAVIVREFFPPEEAGVRVGTVLMATVFGMARRLDVRSDL